MRNSVIHGGLSLGASRFLRYAIQGCSNFHMCRKNRSNRGRQVLLFLFRSVRRVLSSGHWRRTRSITSEMEESQLDLTSPVAVRGRTVFDSVLKRQLHRNVETEIGVSSATAAVGGRERKKKEKKRKKRWTTPVVDGGRRATGRSLASLSQREIRNEPTASYPLRYATSVSPLFPVSIFFSLIFWRIFFRTNQVVCVWGEGGEERDGGGGMMAVHIILLLVIFRSLYFLLRFSRRVV